MDSLRKLEEFASLHWSASSQSLESREVRWICECVFQNFSPEEREGVLLELLEKRGKGVPLAYLLGTQPFYNIELKVTPDVLVPRPETEELEERLLKILPKKGVGLDLGCGSGAIALALAKALPDWRFSAVDVSSAALGVAKENALNLKLDRRVSFYLGSWFEPLPLEESYDLIVTNPPYVGTEEEIDLGATFEPALALFAGKDGLEEYRAILPSVKNRLNPGGFFAGECGPYHGSALLELAKKAGLKKAKILKDASGRDRFLFAAAE